MKKIFLTTLLTSLLITSVHAGEPLGKIITEKGVEKIILVPSLTKYIEEEFSDYKVPSAPTETDKSDPENPIIAGKLPGAMVNGDFNGDKNMDIALILESDSLPPLFVVFESQANNKYYHVILEVISAHIYLQEPKKIRTFGRNSSTINLKNDAITIIYGMAAALFYWDGKHYVKEWTSD